LAIQGQDPRGARLSVRTRARAASATEVDAALSSGDLLITWLNRGTLHLVRSQDYWWLRELTTPQLWTANARRLSQEGVSSTQAERGVDVLAEHLQTQGPRTRAQLRDALDVAGIPTAGQAFVHVLAAASLRGELVRGPMEGGEHCFVSARSWLGAAPDPMERPAALALLARRYLAGHGPASAHDLAKWAGIRVADARRGLTEIADELTHRPDGLVDLVDREPAAGLPPPRLLGPFDPLLHGWTGVDPIVGTHRTIVTTNGLFRPFALVDGRAVATWGLSGGLLTIRPLERIGRADLKALADDAAVVLQFLGLPQQTPVLEQQPG
jgi:hypothetical protein